MTKRDKDILNFIKEYMLEHGVVPSMREIGDGLNLYSTATVFKHMKNLVQSGEIVWFKEKSCRYKVKGMKYVREDT